MPYGPVEPFDLVALEHEVLERWSALGVIEHVRQARKDGEPWIFYEGPPTANGRPGLHHVWPRVFKDLYPRFQTMRGRRVPRKGGWDCHGLPVELEVEKELGLSSKAQIEEYGIGAFNARCQASVSRYVEDFISLTERSGTWIDTTDAYWTLSREYIESVWWLLRQLWDKGLLYEGHRVSPYCPRCGTALSSHEMGQPDVYRDLVDPSIYVRFPLADDDADLLVWTTTPWTLVSNVAVAVGPDIAYVRVHEPEGRDLVLAEAAAERLFGAGAPYDVVDRTTGAELVGRRYRRPFDLLDFGPGEAEVAERVVAATWVSTDDGSGLVHLSPAFGEDDAAVGRAEGLPVLNPVRPDGTFDERVGPWAGVRVKQADRGIIDDLAARQLLVREQEYLHSYPHCWRCSTPLIYWAKTSWFVRTAEQRAALVDQNDTIGWHPDHIKHGRFGKWLETNIDWALSRDRYWGTPLPIWRCPSGHDTCVGSVAELARLAGRDLGELDLHRPAVDDVSLICPAEGCGQRARRLAPVLDAWFDSGAMPSAQFHYPFEGDEPFGSSYPADFICEAIDQTRGWFYSLLAVNTLVFGTTPYRNVVCLGLIVDGEGQKMSKSRGNVIDPNHVFETAGADALRWYFFSAGQPWTPRRVSEDGIREAARQTLLTLWNVYAFFATYADLEGFTAGTATTAAVTNVLDRWVLGQLEETVAEVTTALDDFDALRATSRLAHFVDNLSNWYVRRSRPRFWRASDPAAHAVLHRCLTVTCELLAPFCPFLADELWCRLTGGLTVHAADWPTVAGASDDDRRLAEEMEAGRRLVALGRAARTEAGIKVRQPLRRALLLHPGTVLGDDVRAEIADELNVKSLEDIDALSGLVRWSVVPNFRVLGPRLGSRVNEVKAALADADGSVLRDALERDGFVEVAGVRLDAGDVEIRAERQPEIALAQDSTWAVALDLEVNTALRREGTARDAVRALNDLRRDLDFAIAERIEVTLVTSDAELRAAIEAHRGWVAEEILATRLEVVEDTGGDRPGSSIDLDGAEVGVELLRRHP
ncbi:MAG TPA: isoleucine--tRNA ligase [Acidimicrobiales bacterium]|nr:isoleucine--tRNA ligase [Acidimicrobiales bacterium]